MMRRHASPRPTRLRGPVAIAVLFGGLTSACQGTPYNMRFDAAVLDVPPEVTPDAERDATAEDVPSCVPSQAEILLASACGWCHYTGVGALDLTNPGMADRLIGVAPTWAQEPPYGCADSGVLVETTLPPSGIFMDKLINTQTCGSSMAYLSSDKIECVRQWLADQIAARSDASAGADGGDGGS